MNTLFQDPFEILNKQIEILKQKIDEEWEKSFPNICKLLEAGQMSAAINYRNRVRAQVAQMEQEIIFTMLRTPPFVNIRANGEFENVGINSTNIHLIKPFLK